ncbi:unnamed protein product [Pleuronectes platessa]|uniref:Uncharacterized protein n=1 Tax=Pleuronectes platessa TaxID=8262 RepID=A0A9N7VPP9_PLEPL|nr:unnamed protein product [Pleuronectes platessa]
MADGGSPGSCSIPPVSSPNLHSELSVELHVGNTVRLFAAANGAKDEGELREGGVIRAGPCQSRMKQDHPGWRQELGRGSGRLVGGPAGSPYPRLRQQAAAGTLRPCQRLVIHFSLCNLSLALRVCVRPGPLRQGCCAAVYVCRHVRRLRPQLTHYHLTPTTKPPKGLDSFVFSASVSAAAPLLPGPWFPRFHFPVPRWSAVVFQGAQGLRAPVVTALDSSNAAAYGSDLTRHTHPLIPSIKDTPG